MNHADKKKDVEGVVVSNRMQKTVIVAVERLVRHPRYEKQIKRTTRLAVHDEQEACQMGDRVLIRSCRPLSKTKSWTLTEVLTLRKKQDV